MGRLVAVLDANVLFPARVRDLFVRLAIAELYRALWSDQILDECFRNVIEARLALSPAALQRTRELMNVALPDATIVGFEHHIDRIELPDPDDRHVVAAAIHAHASLIVTWNLKDFPAERLDQHNLAAISPDSFGCDLFEQHSASVMATLVEQASALRHPPTSLTELLDGLAEAGLRQLAAKAHASIAAENSARPNAPRRPTRAHLRSARQVSKR